MPLSKGSSFENGPAWWFVRRPVLSQHFIFAGKYAGFGIVLDHHDAGTFARRERSVSRLSGNSLPPLGTRQVHREGRPSPLDAFDENVAA